MTLKRMLKTLYLRACIDVIQHEKEGRGKELCKQRLQECMAAIADGRVVLPKGVRR